MHKMENFKISDAQKAKMINSFKNDKHKLVTDIEGGTQAEDV